jgi:hypothetical protein
VGAESAFLVENSLLPLSWSLAAPPAMAVHAVNGITKAKFYAAPSPAGISCYLFDCGLYASDYSNANPLSGHFITNSDKPACNHSHSYAKPYYFTSGLV